MAPTEPNSIIIAITHLNSKKNYTIWLSFIILVRPRSLIGVLAMFITKSCGFNRSSLARNFLISEMVSSVLLYLS